MVGTFKGSTLTHQLKGSNNNKKFTKEIEIFRPFSTFIFNTA